MLTAGISSTPPDEQLPARTLQAKASAAYGSQSRETQEERWILSCLPMVRHIAQKVSAQASCRQDTDELISAGTLGLVKAARAYDQTRDAEFRTYAYIRIRGAMIDELRSRSFVPSAVHNQIRLVQETFARMSAAQSTPSDEQLATELNMPLEELYSILEKGRQQHFLHIHGLSDEGSPLGALQPVDRAPSPEAQAERKEMVENLVAAMTQLPTRDRHILMLYYERDLTMKEVAQVLSVTESRVSQLHASALMKLAAKLKGKGSRQ